MNRYLKHSVIFLVGLNVLITVLGFVSLQRSPYTGILFIDPCGENGCSVGEVDEGSPAWLAGIRPGDIILDVNNMGLPSFAFSYAPDILRSAGDVRLFWETQQRLTRIITEDRPVDILIKRGDRQLNISVTPIRFPLSRSAARFFPHYIFPWGYLLIGFLIIRKKMDSITVHLFVYLAFVGIGDLSEIGYCLHDLSYPYHTFRLLTSVNLIGGSIVPVIFLHFALRFPRKKMVIDRYAGVVTGFYGFCTLIILLGLMNMIDGTYNFLYIFWSGALYFLSCSLFLYDLVREKDPVYRRQVQWLVYGFSVFIIYKFVLVNIPILFLGFPVIRNDGIFMLVIALLPPAGLAISVTRYRLMDIEDVFDYTVIFGATLLVLAGIEIGFMIIIAPYYAEARGDFPYASLLLVIVLVFIYMPIRSMIRKGVERLFKRGAYKVEDEVQGFTLSIGVDDSVPLLDKFTTYVKKLLGPSEILILKMDKEKDMERDRVRVGTSDKGTALLDAISQDPVSLCDYFIRHRWSAYGYDLVDRGVIKTSTSRNINNALFVPFFMGKNVSYIGILLEKWNSTAYLKRDRQLLDAIATAMSHILEAEDMRRVRVKMEEDLRREREDVMKEMHDGLGSILTNITVASQVAGQVIDGNVEKAREMVGVIRSFSAEASDFLRAGLSMLDNHKGEIGPVITHIRHRLGGMLETCGINVNFDVGDGVEGLRTGTHMNLNIIRCIQEGFNNILKHSDAGNVSMRFLLDGIGSNNAKLLKVEIWDDGRGFDLGRSKDAVNGCFGLSNMNRRIRG